MKFKYHLFCLITICAFSTLELVSKLLKGGISPFTITAWRFLIGGMVILPFALRQLRYDKKHLTLNSILSMGALGILNVCVSMLFLQLAVHFGKASLSAILVSLNPIFVSIFSPIILKERLAKIQFIGLLAGLCGIVLIVLGEEQLHHQSYINLPLGIVFALLAATTFGLYTVLTKRTVIRYGNLLTNSMSFIMGAIILFFVNAVIGKPLFFAMSRLNVISIAYLGIVITGIAYLLYFEGMKGLTAPLASQYFFLKPVIAGSLSVLILGESLGVMQLMGILFIILALLGNTLLPKSMRKAVPVKQS